MENKTNNMLKTVLFVMAGIWFMPLIVIAAPAPWRALCSSLDGIRMTSAFDLMVVELLPVTLAASVLMTAAFVYCAIKLPASLKLVRWLAGAHIIAAVALVAADLKCDTGHYYIWYDAIALLMGLAAGGGLLKAAGKAPEGSDAVTA